MPTSIPFDPTLVLGQIIDTTKVDALKAIEDAEKGVETAEMNLNSLIQAKISLDNTVFQVKSLGVEMSQEMAKSMDTLSDNITAAASKLVEEKIKAYGPGGTVEEALTAANGIINITDESPIDYERSQIKRLPLSSDSIVFDSQYFSFDKNDQSLQNNVTSIKSFISASVSFLGAKRSSQFSASVTQQVADQQEKHDVIGTLVITAKTTIEDAKIISPLVLDIDKAIRIWNATKGDKIEEDDLVRMAANLKSPPTDSINLLDGVTLGSAFVGMVHVLRSESTDTSQRMRTVSSSLQAQMKRGGWFARMQGGFGVNKSFSDDVKRLLSKQQISSHCSIVCIGVIPSIRSNQVQLGVKRFAHFDPAAMMRKLATLANATCRETNSIAISAEAARTGKRMVLMRNAKIQSVISSLGKIDDGANRSLDINSLMNAFEDFVGKVAVGNAGVPINFYVKNITKAQLAQAWVDENFSDGPPIMDVNTEVNARSFEIQPAVLRAAPRVQPSAPRSAPRVASLDVRSSIASRSTKTDIRADAGDFSEEIVRPSVPTTAIPQEVSSSLEVSREEPSFIRLHRGSMMSTVTDVSAGGGSEALPSSTWRERRDELTLSMVTEQSQDEEK